MALKRLVDSLESVPEAARGLYTEEERDGKKVYVLGEDYITDGMVDKSKLKEFRDNNINLVKQFEEFRKKFEGVDPEKYAEAIEKQRKIDEKKMLDAGKVDELVNSRVEEMSRAHKAAMEERDTELSSMRGQLEELRIVSVVTEAAGAKKALTGAIPDLISRARQVFVLEDGKAVAKKNGETWYGADGVTPVTISEWMDKQTVDAPHLFQQSSGSGASNQGGGAGSGAPKHNPYKRGEHFNLTKQGILERDNPALAKRLKAEAQG